MALVTDRLALAEGQLARVDNRVVQSGRTVGLLAADMLLAGSVAALASDGDFVKKGRDQPVWLLGVDGQAAGVAIQASLQQTALKVRIAVAMFVTWRKLKVAPCARIPGDGRHEHDPIAVDAIGLASRARPESQSHGCRLVIQGAAAFIHADFVVQDATASLFNAIKQVVLSLKLRLTG
jgi:hypothetical protein